MTYPRHIETYLRKIEKKYKCITLIGPRQSGKTTLAKRYFKNYAYVSFENPNQRHQFEFDPVGYLQHFSQSVIFDEVQHVPDLLPYLQEILDNKKDKRKFVLTGSTNLLLDESIAQSLAGRTRILNILPLSWHELPKRIRLNNVDQALYTGLFPKIYHKNLPPSEWLADYYRTYVEKDVRSVLNVSDLRDFDRFMRLMAGRTGQLLYLSSLAGDTGITHPTAKSWLSVLETSFICFTLQPHFRNFSKRLVKAPKAYFYDTGLLCYLLRIQNPQQLTQHPLRGLIFENWVIVEKMKGFFNQGLEAPLYFWRDQHGHEIDLVEDTGTHLELYEIKSSMTFQPSYFKNIDWLNKLQNASGGTYIYAGSKNIVLNEKSVRSWRDI